MRRNLDWLWRKCSAVGQRPFACAAGYVCIRWPLISLNTAPGSAGSGNDEMNERVSQRLLSTLVFTLGLSRFRFIHGSYHQQKTKCECNRSAQEYHPPISAGMWKIITLISRRLRIGHDLLLGEGNPARASLAP